MTKPCVKCRGTERYSNGHCAPCARARNAKRKENSPDKVKEEDRLWKAANRDKTRGYQLRFHYGITEEQYDQMLAAQKGLCKLCLQSPSGKKKFLCVDHDHTTSKVRGLLCHNCNVALGYLKDRLDVAARIPSYLEGTL